MIFYLSTSFNQTMMESPLATHFTCISFMASPFTWIQKANIELVFSIYLLKHAFLCQILQYKIFFKSFIIVVIYWCTVSLLESAWKGRIRIQQYECDIKEYILGSKNNEILVHFFVIVDVLLYDLIRVRKERDTIWIEFLLD